MCRNRKSVLLWTAVLAALASNCPRLDAAQEAVPSAPSAIVWRRHGPPGGNVVSLASAGDGTLYLGTPDGHVFVSRDGAAQWELRGRVSSRYDAVVQRLLVDTRNSQRVFAAVWTQDPSAGGGLYRSEDGARTWTPAGLAGEAVRAIEQSASEPAVFVAGARSGVFRSSDNGATWQRISPAGDEELRNLDSIAIDPRSAQVVYAGTYHLPWKTTDGGKTWAPIASGMIDDSDIMSLRIDAANPDRVYASACSGIYRSENGGAQWVKLQGIPYAARRTQAIAQDPDDLRAVYAATTEGLWVSRDAGESWTRTTSGNTVANAIAFSKKTGGAERLVLGTEEPGILVSEDAGLHFAEANAGFAHRVVANLVALEKEGTWRVLIRTGGLHSELFESKPEPDEGAWNWSALPGEAPEGSIKKLFASGGTWWAALDAGGLSRYDAVARKWRSVKFVEASVPAGRAPNSARKPARAAQALPEIFDLQTSGARIFAATSRGLWAGTSDLLRPIVSKDKELTGSVRGLEVSADGARIWAITPQNIFLSADAGKTWERHAIPADGGTPLWIVERSGSQGVELFLGTQKGVFRTQSDFRPDWTLVASGLPAVASDRMIVSGKLMAIAMKPGGLYLSGDDGTSWERADTALEAGIFVGLAPDTRGGLIIGSTSEGVLEVSVEPRK